MSKKQKTATFCVQNADIFIASAGGKYSYRNCGEMEDIRK